MYKFHITSSEIADEGHSLLKIPSATTVQLQHAWYSRHYLGVLVSPCIFGIHGGPVGIYKDCYSLTHTMHTRGLWLVALNGKGFQKNIRI